MNRPDTKSALGIRQSDLGVKLAGSRRPILSGNLELVAELGRGLPQLETRPAEIAVG